MRVIRSGSDATGICIVQYNTSSTAGGSSHMMGGEEAVPPRHVRYNTLGESGAIHSEHSGEQTVNKSKVKMYANKKGPT